ncbi:MAG: bifunctional UDP-N-acetylglucosamine diphosphorylase/glucosamine-1-phosphate N-acetyltransferase GlmU [Nocardioidaceae bacterium]|nr:bifunctional UDP-N-acetylglucosamine diphosphorylase/glucosamine-1-phosphate N-acetyltransferase GlmU [Nocardioidaceae bacterium]
MRSATPKVLHRIGGRSLLGHVLAAASTLEPHETVVVVGHGRDLVVSHVADCEPAARTAVQHDQRGTGHATAVGLDALAAEAGIVVVVMGDTPLLTGDTLRRLASAHAAGGNAVTALTFELDDPTGYGRIIRDVSGTPTAIVEQRDATTAQLATTELNAGVYAFDLGQLRDGLARLDQDNAAGEAYLTDMVALAHADGRGVGALMVKDSCEATGVNDRVQLAQLGAELNRRVLAGWMRAGVTVVDPTTTWIDVGVELARDVTLLPGVQLLGTTRVDEGAMVGPDTTLSDVTVGARASVVRTHGSAASIGASATVGPFACLRPGSELAEHAKIGSYVETKNARIGSGAKVPHLSYIGDAEIGDGTNIGAGTITANYDGVAKHRTIVGRHCKTGSDNVFVAPVRIGDGAATGAGTVVRRDVAPGALAVSGGTQRQIDDWVLRRRGDTASARAAIAARTSGVEEGDPMGHSRGLPPSTLDEGTRP